MSPGTIPGAPGMPGTIGISCIPGTPMPRPKGAMPRGNIPGIKLGNGFMFVWKNEMWCVLDIK